jgi:hypothetical protein
MRRRKLEYPRSCGILVNMREPTDRERWIDLRPAAENPETPTRECGAILASWDYERRHMAGVHPNIWAVIELLAEVRSRRIRENL